MAQLGLGPYGRLAAQQACMCWCVVLIFSLQMSQELKEQWASSAMGRMDVSSLNMQLVARAQQDPQARYHCTLKPFFLLHECWPS